VAIACAAEHKRVSLEMGGKNPILVMEDADLDLAVEGTIWGAFGTSGQRCTAASRILVHKKVMRDFADRLVTKTQALRLGDGLSPDTDVGPIINDAQLRRVHGYTRIGLKEGARLLCGGEIYREGDCKKGFFYAPTVLGEVSSKMRVAQEEIYGPSVSLLPVAGLEEAIEVANANRYGLNAPTIGAEVHLPFGGLRQTGNGHREGGRQALDVFTEWKAVYIDYSGRLQRAQIDRR
jgi:aldehyde dehydrogenase (NAD+)